MADHDEDGIGAAARPSDGPGRVERVAEYLDLDCDGVPDAVLTTQTVEVGVVGGPDVIETVESWIAVSVMTENRARSSGGRP